MSDAEKAVEAVAENAATEAANRTAAAVNATVQANDAAATGAVAAAETAAALANASAAQAQQLSAEQLGTYKSEIEAWRLKMEEQLAATRAVAESLTSEISSMRQSMTPPKLVEQEPVKVEVVEPEKAAQDGDDQKAPKTEAKKPKRRFI